MEIQADVAESAAGSEALRRWSDTIAAISTPFGEGAIALIRLSGPGAVDCASGVFAGRKRLADVRSHRQHFGQIVSGGRKLDDVLIAVHRQPHSYTGEDVVEISCHGGVLVARRILDLLLRTGARPAEPGEFTQRAYVNGKLDLTQAEAVMDVISAQSDLALRAASEQLEGRLGALMRSLREDLLGILAHVEAYIDFPDEDIDPETGAALLARVDEASAQVRRLLDTAGRGRILREGVRTVIYGAPNAGKSSLLNHLLGFERAIVSARPGTTRDSLEEAISLRGIPLRLVDTAGLRESQDDIEVAGMERTRREIARADLALHVFDGSEPAPAEAPDPADIVVINKADLTEHGTWSNAHGVRISCATGAGMDDLADAIEQRVLGGTTAHQDWTVAINARHEACLRRAAGALQAARDGMLQGFSPELVAEELREAMDAVGDVVGRVDSEELLGRIFSTFCIGK